MSTIKGITHEPESPETVRLTLRIGHQQTTDESWHIDVAELLPSGIAVSGKIDGLKAEEVYLVVDDIKVQAALEHFSEAMGPADQRLEVRNKERAAREARIEAQIQAFRSTTRSVEDAPHDT